MGFGSIGWILIVDIIIGFLSGFLFKGKANWKFWNNLLGNTAVYIALFIGLFFYFKYNSGIPFIDDFIELAGYMIFFVVLISLLVLISIFTLGVYFGNKVENKFK